MIATMVLHKKHQILSTIRSAVLNGDSIEQAKSLCIHDGFNDQQIGETLALFEEFKPYVNFDNVDFWNILSFEIFNLALENNDFQESFNLLDRGLVIFNLRDVGETLLLILDKFRLLDICKYSGYKMIIEIPEYYQTEIAQFNRRTNIEQFENILANKKALGLEGELFVLNEEQNRLGGDFIIKHISQIDVGAGYDIQSWRDDKSYADSNKLYIEVKTISLKKEVFLSQNELETARQLGPKYRLYIVRKIQNRLFTYKIIDDFFTYFNENINEFIIHPTYMMKV